MVLFGIAGLLGFSFGFLAGAGYATRGAGNQRDEAERYAVECDALKEEVALLRQVLNEPESRVVPKEQAESQQKMAG